MAYNTSTSEVVYTSVAPSDARLKTDISDASVGLDFIKKLRPVEFKWKNRLQQHVIDDIYEKLYGSTLAASIKSPLSPGVRTHLGFIAQEVKAVIDTTGKDYSIYTREQDSSIPLYDLQSVHTNELIAPIVKAIQEQDAIVQIQASTILLLGTQVSTLTSTTQGQDFNFQLLGVQVSSLMSTTQGQALEYVSLVTSISTLLSLNNLPPMI